MKIKYTYNGNAILIFSFEEIKMVESKEGYHIRKYKEGVILDYIMSNLVFRWSLSENIIRSDLKEEIRLCIVFNKEMTRERFLKEIYRFENRIDYNPFGGLQVVPEVLDMMKEN